jgi:hypothetical protein
LFSLKYEKKAIEQVSKELNVLNLEMDEEWPGTKKFTPISNEKK